MPISRLRANLCIRTTAAFLAAMMSGAALTTSAQTPPQQAQSYSFEDRQFVGACAALYRWQGGPQDPAYLKVKAFWDKIGGRSSKTQDVISFIKRDAIQESVAAGRFKLASSLKNCSDTLGVAPASAPRTSAFPEASDPAVVSAMNSCLALQRWSVGTDTFETRDSISTYAAYARVSEDAARAKAKEGMDNLDNAINGGVDPSVLMVAKDPCAQDYHIIILGKPDQRHSLEYMAAHPAPPPVAVARTDPAPYTPPAPAAPKRPARSPLWNGERLYTSGGVDVTDTQSSDACLSAMDDATVRIMPDLNRLTMAMERDKNRYCPSDGRCNFESNGAAVLACSSVNQGRGMIPSQCLKERVILENLREKVCPQN